MSKTTMNSIKRKTVILFFILSIGIFFPQVCPSDLQGPDFFARGGCTASSHLLVHGGWGVIFFLILPFLGFFLLLNPADLPKGFALPPFRPPRYNT